MVLQGDFEGHLYGLLRTPLSPSLWPLELHLYGPPGTLWGPSLWSLGPSLWSSGDPFGAISMAFRATPMVLQEHFWGPSLWSLGPHFSGPPRTLLGPFLCAMGSLVGPFRSPLPHSPAPHLTGEGQRPPHGVEAADEVVVEALQHRGAHAGHNAHGEHHVGGVGHLNPQFGQGGRGGAHAEWDDVEGAACGGAKGVGGP